MKENLDTFPAIYYSLYRQRKTRIQNKEISIDDFIEVHYKIIKKLQEILLVHGHAIRILGYSIKITKGEIKKAFLLKPKELTWEDEIISDYWKRLIAYIEEKLETNSTINFFNLFFIKKSSEAKKSTLNFKIY